MVADVPLLQNPCFSMGFVSIVALTRGVVCAPAHRGCCAFASKSMLYQWFYKHCGSHWGVLSAIPLIVVADVRLLQIYVSPLVFISMLGLIGGAVCDPAHRGC